MKKRKKKSSLSPEAAEVVEYVKNAGLSTEEMGEVVGAVTALIFRTAFTEAFEEEE